MKWRSDDELIYGDIITSIVLKYAFLSHSLPFTYLKDPRTSSTTIMTPTVTLAMSALGCESSILLTHSLLIFSQMNNSPLSPLSPASLATSFLRSLRTPATENPWTSGWRVWSLPHAYTNERQAHCFLSLHSHYHVRSPLRLLPFLCRQHQGPCPAKCWLWTRLSEAVLEPHFWWSQILYPTFRRPPSSHHPGGFTRPLCRRNLVARWFDLE